MDSILQNHGYAVKICPGVKICPIISILIDEIVYSNIYKFSHPLLWKINSTIMYVSTSVLKPTKQLIHME